MDKTDKPTKDTEMQEAVVAASLHKGSKGNWSSAFWTMNAKPYTLSGGYPAELMDEEYVEYCSFIRDTEHYRLCETTRMESEILKYQQAQEPEAYLLEVRETVKLRIKYHRDLWDISKEWVENLQRRREERASEERAAGAMPEVSEDARQS